MNTKVSGTKFPYGNGQRLKNQENKIVFPYQNVEKIQNKLQVRKLWFDILFHVINSNKIIFKAFLPITLSIWGLKNLIQYIYNRTMSITVE